MSKTAATDLAPVRPKRVPLAGRNRLKVKDQDPDKSYRYVNANDEHDPDRVERFLEAGYTLVPRRQSGTLGDNKVDNTSPMGSVAEVSVGQGMKAVLMAQPREWYDEDQRAKMAELDAIERTMKSESKSDYGTLNTNAPIDK